MLDAEEARLTQTGTLTMSAGRVEISGFSGDGCSCRDLAALSIVWAIGELQKELAATLQSPRGSRCVVD
jgi:hypothetical protein